MPKSPRKAKKLPIITLIGRHVIGMKPSSIHKPGVSTADKDAIMHHMALSAPQRMRAFDDLPFATRARIWVLGMEGKHVQLSPQEFIRESTIHPISRHNAVIERIGRSRSSRLGIAQVPTVSRHISREELELSTLSF